MIDIPLIMDREHPCSYQVKKQARLLYVHPEFPPINNLYTHLISQGFRRSGQQLYRPHCDNCQDCIPLRVPVNLFKPSKSQRRILKINTNTTTRLTPATFNEHHFEIFTHYQNNRHSGGEMSQLSRDDYLNFLTGPWCDTLFMEILINDSIVGVTVIDQLDQALSAVYTFYHPDYSHLSLGHFAILKMIHHASLKNQKWVYLGFWIEPCQNMAYKINYRPTEAFIKDQWSLYEKNQSIIR
ncbi:MAG: arginyltransferase [Methylococcales bacterium]|jgi:arginine-tRNA-protein transferase|nr:arginyltransferase [Methylococcales bacterium]MBT6794093.1 arginyltransferase [Methylococcales bacterium]MBT7108193.1 arginyltransferase [Methylococcales bacterium]